MTTCARDALLPILALFANEATMAIRQAPARRPVIAL